MKKRYLLKTLRTSEEYSSTDLIGIATNIEKHQERNFFWKKMVPISIAIAIVIVFFVLR